MCLLDKFYNISINQKKGVINICGLLINYIPVAGIPKETRNELDDRFIYLYKGGVF